MANDSAYMTYANGMLISLRIYRWSWFTHWAELALNFLPRRWRWFISANSLNRGSPINQHIIDSTGVLSARNLAAGLMSGKTSPTRPWFSFGVGNIDDTQTSAASLWLAECKRRMQLVMEQSNFYNAIAQWYFDLVIFGTAVLMIYEDYDDVINCQLACAGEYYVFLDGAYRPNGLAREFTLTVQAVVDRWGYAACSQSTQKLYDQRDGSGKNQEVVIAHLIEPNTDGKNFVEGRYAYRECYWEYGNSQSPQGGPPSPPRFLEVKGYFEQPQATCRWDLTGNDPYGRSVGMDALGDQKQLQVETRRKAQAIDKMVNPPLALDGSMKNTPASLLPGALNYINGMMTATKPGISSIYETRFPVSDITEDLNEVRERLKYTFFNHLFQPISQFETKSNITTVEIDQRRAEALIMLGPVFTRVDTEGLKVIVERVFNIMLRAGLFPPPPPEIAGQPINIKFVSMLAQAQSAIAAASIERLFGFLGNIVAVKPDVMDVVDTDFSVEEYAHLQDIDPRVIRTTEALAALREANAKAAQAAQQADIAEKLSAGAKNLSAADMGGGQNALQAVTGGGQA